MEIQSLLQASYLDILFEGRNKNYGGYELRTHYANRARKATALVILGAFVCSTIPLIASKISGEHIVRFTPVERVIKLEHLPEKPEDIPIIPPPPAQQLVAIIADPIPVVVPDQQADQNPPPSMEDLKGKDIGITTTVGVPGDVSMDTKGTSGTNNTLVDIPTTPPPIPRMVDQMPVFNGDLDKYLRDNSRYPDESRISGESGTVYVEFVVNEDGRVSNASVVKSAYANLNAEAIRVVSAMPKWKPGKQNGVPTKVYFRLPITFTLE